MAFVISFLLRRLMQSIVIIFLVTFLIFTLLRMAPGDPARMIVGPMATQETVDAKAEELGLRDPLIVQYGRYMADMIRGNFGNSYIRAKSGQTAGTTHSAPDESNQAEVSALIGARLLLTLQLAGLSVVFAFLISGPIGIAAGVYRLRWPDTVSILVSSVMVSIPNYLLGLILTLFFAIKLGWLPAVGYQGFSYTILPAFVLAIELSPVLIRSISLSLGAVLNESFIRIGEVRGLSRARLIWHHAIRNASVPVLNMFGIQLGTLLGGVMVVEFIFDYPGIGHLAINAVLQRDFPVIQAMTILASVAFVLINILVDLISSIIDPRLEY